MLEREKTQIVMGIDPGFAKLGVVVLEKSASAKKPRVVLASCIQIEKTPKKLLTNLRATTDDQRRYKEIWKALDGIKEKYSPYAVGVEAYTVFQARGGNAWKTGVVFGGIIFWAYCSGLFVAPFLPMDLKKRFCNKKSASKEAVEKSLYKLVDGLEEAVNKIPKTKREHVADAAGHALLVMEEVEEHRKMLGI